MTRSRYIEGCEEHRIPLIDGRCPNCRDANGETFILDMQSKCLLERAGLSCPTCHETLYLPEGLRDEEMKNAAAGFIADHVVLHGGDPEKVPFSVIFDGVLLRCAT